MKRTTLLLVLALFLPLTLAAQTKPDLRTEKIEWTWSDRPATADPKLPNVLLLGDSITRAYYPDTQKLLAGVANVYLFATSACAADVRYGGQLRDALALASVDFAVVHFNNGMHGWRFSDDEYAAALPPAAATLRKLQPHAALVWASTTPVRKDAADGASNSRIVTRNADAAKVMMRLHIAIDDQHTLMQPHADLHADDVHWNAAGSALQAAQVAASIRSVLAQ